MSDNELDAIYTRLCKVMTSLGGTQSPLFLARFALLAAVELGNTDIIMRLIDDAVEGIAFSQQPG